MQSKLPVLLNIYGGQDIWRNRIIRLIAYQSRISVYHHLANIFGPRNECPQGPPLGPKTAPLRLKVDDQRLFGQALFDRRHVPVVDFLRPESAFLNLWGDRLRP